LNGLHRQCITSEMIKEGPQHSRPGPASRLPLAARHQGCQEPLESTAGGAWKSQRQNRRRLSSRRITLACAGACQQEWEVCTEKTPQTQAHRPTPTLLLRPRLRACLEAALSSAMVPAVACDAPATSAGTGAGTCATSAIHWLPEQARRSFRSKKDLSPLPALVPSVPRPPV